MFLQLILTLMPFNIHLKAHSCLCLQFFLLDFKQMGILVKPYKSITVSHVHIMNYHQCVCVGGGRCHILFVV